MANYFGKELMSKAMFGKSDLEERRMRERCKEVSMFTVRGEYIKTYKSISMASRENKINISNIAQAMKGLRKTAGGFTWKEEVYH